MPDDGLFINISRHEPFPDRHESLSQHIIITTIIACHYQSSGPIGYQVITSHYSATITSNRYEPPL